MLCKPVRILHLRTPTSENSSIFPSSCKMFILEIIKENAAAKKKMKIINTTSKIITSEDWIGGRKTKNRK